MIDLRCHRFLFNARWWIHLYNVLMSQCFSFICLILNKYRLRRAGIKKVWHPSSEVRWLGNTAGIRPVKISFIPKTGFQQVRQNKIPRLFQITFPDISWSFLQHLLGRVANSGDPYILFTQEISVIMNGPKFKLIKFTHYIYMQRSTHRLASREPCGMSKNSLTMTLPGLQNSLTIPGACI